jgi:hypothetical protein
MGNQCCCNENVSRKEEFVSAPVPDIKVPEPIDP